jgi:hypothetical protein
VQEPQPVSIVQDYAVVSDQEHKVKVFDFKARGRDTQDNWAIHLLTDVFDFSFLQESSSEFLVFPI